MKFYLSSLLIGNREKKLKQFIKKKKIGYIPNAMDLIQDNSKKKLAHIANNLNSLKKLGLKPEILDLKFYFNKEEKLEKKLNELGAVWINGGNTFVLRQAMSLSGFDNYVKNHLNDNFVYAGFSAGVCVLAQDMAVLKFIDEPNVFPYIEINKTIWEGLSVLDYMILPHYSHSLSSTSSKCVNKAVEYCEKNNIAYKTLVDAEVIIIE